MSTSQSSRKSLTNRLAYSPIQRHCVGPTNAFVEFKKEDVEGSITGRFEEQVARYPGQLAVKTRNHEMTYDELNKVSNQIARAILAQREQERTPIALLLEHDAQVIAAILAVMKIGQMYVPLDASYPQTRLQYMLQDSQANLIVTNRQNLSLARQLAQNACQLLNIDALDSSLPNDNLEFSVSPGTPFYIIYTSGSTGQPKGIVHNHRNMLHIVMNYTNYFHICAEDRLTLLHSCSFASSLPDICKALLNGATLFSFDVKAEGLANVADWLIQEEITVLNWGPTSFRCFVNFLSVEKQFPRLRLLNLGGETVLRKDVELYKKHFAPECIFANRLGATETGFFRLHLIDKETPITGSLVPVGYAVDDMEVRLVNEDGQEVEVNQVGEIVVKSRYLSPGYWRRPDLTRAAFLPDPEGGSEQTYHTGDLGRMLPDGCLMHLGRKDFQVKVRGHRIELAEIEMALLDLDVIKQAIVVAQEDEQGEQQLVAYLVATPEAMLTLPELRRLLTEKLPDYMMPTSFVFLDALPMTPNGKLDRQALSELEKKRYEMDNSFIAPRTPLEKSLAEIWAEVMGRSRVSIHDHFLDLGGHSLLATQIISRVIDTFSVEVSSQSFLNAFTVADMAIVLTQSLAEKADRENLDRTLTELETLSDHEAQTQLDDST